MSRCGQECFFLIYVFFFKQKTAYEMRISDWSSDVCSSDLYAWLTVWMLFCAPVLQARLVTGIKDLDALYRQRGEELARAKQEIESRSEERRVGKECVSTSRSRRSPDH